MQQAALLALVIAAIALPVRAGPDVAQGRHDEWNADRARSKQRQGQPGLPRGGGARRRVD